MTLNYQLAGGLKMPPASCLQQDSPGTPSSQICQHLPWRMHSNWNKRTCIFPSIFAQETDLGKVSNTYALLPPFDYSSGVFEVWRLSRTWAFSSGFLTCSSFLQAAPLVPARSPLKTCSGVFLLLSFTAFVYSRPAEVTALGDSSLPSHIFSLCWSGGSWF